MGFLNTGQRKMKGVDKNVKINRIKFFSRKVYFVKTVLKPPQVDR